MPLIVPGVMSSGNGSDNKQDEWLSKLMGKTLTDSATDHSSFSKKDLPSNHRVLELGSDIADVDDSPDRLNVYVDDHGIVKDVKMG